MVKKKDIFLAVVIGMGIMCLTGCGIGFVPNSTEDDMSDMDNVENSTTEADTDTAMPPDKSQSGAEEEPEQDESENEADTTPKQVPQLPGTGRGPADFVPEGWELLDSVELDFNEDGVPDYVGVMEAVLIDMGGYWMRQDYPRILFAIASNGTDGYRLDFQDINLIRTSEEGGVFGDPYLPLTAEGTSFTTHAYGGSAWKWSEDNTYTYRGGVWWLAADEDTYGYGDYTTSYGKSDWESGVGIRKKKSSEFIDMEENWEENETGYGEDSQDEEEYWDMEWEMSLDEPPTLEQAGKRWWLALDRVTDWEVESVTFVGDMELTEDKVVLPEQASSFSYCDEDCMLYTFSDMDKGKYYLAMYRWQDRVLSVLAEEETRIDNFELYKGKIYYATEIVESVTFCRTVQDEKKQITEETTVGIRLHRMELDGSSTETVFEYRYPKAGQDIMEGYMPYLSLITEISGDEIVAEVYIGDEPHPVYRMDTDGSRQRKIGQIPRE